tara:strand:+ start:74 stop:565 length:492 start_codon:yes stop_codon:yes gene_type:complete
MANDEKPKKRTIRVKKKILTSKKKEESKATKPKPKMNFIIKPKAKPTEPIKKSGGRQAVEYVMDSEHRYTMARLFGKAPPKKEMLYVSGDKVYGSATGGKVVAKMVEGFNGKDIKYPGKGGMLLSKSSKGFYYDKDGFKKDWWKTTKVDKGELSTKAYEYNIV